MLEMPPERAATTGMPEASDSRVVMPKVSRVLGCTSRLARVIASDTPARSMGSSNWTAAATPRSRASCRHSSSISLVGERPTRRSVAPGRAAWTSAKARIRVAIPLIGLR